MTVSLHEFRTCHRLPFAVLGMLLLALPLFAIPALAAQAQSFVSKQYAVDGGWELVEENGNTLIRFNQAFSTKSGPDLKVFLSPETIDQVTGKTATTGAVLLGKLQSTHGTQDYLVPSDVSLDEFASILVHCEHYSVLWGGGDLAGALATP